ncbi:MAG: hypothetical protein ABEJ74_03765 [Haloferacaceae archaeon]
MTYVLGTGPLTSLARVGRLDVLEGLHREVLVTERVYRPFAEHAFRGAPPARRVERAADDGLFRVFALPEGTEIVGSLRENPRLTRADAATLSLADYAGGAAVADATYTRKLARVEGLRARGTARLLVDAAADGDRSPAEVLDLVDALLSAGWTPAPADYAEIVEALTDLD